MPTTKFQTVSPSLRRRVLRATGSHAFALASLGSLFAACSGSSGETSIDQEDVAPALDVVQSALVTPPSTPVSGDWNGDGYTDVGIWNGSHAVLTMNPGAGSHVIDRTAPIHQVTLRPTDLPSPSAPVTFGDWDGDRVSTLAVLQPSGSMGYYATNTATQRNYTGPVTAQAGDIPLRGDWNGDTKDGYALYRPSERRFALFQNAQDTQPILTLTFGVAGDVPLSGVWTAGEPESIGVYRALNNTVYTYSRTRNTWDSHAGVSGNVVPFSGRWTNGFRSGVAFLNASSGTFRQYMPSGNTNNYTYAAFDRFLLKRAGAGYVSSVHTQGVPHTDVNGGVRTTYDPAQSFMMRGIWGVDTNAMAALDSAGFNTAFIWPTYHLDDLKNDLVGTNMRTILTFTREGGVPLVGHFSDAYTGVSPGVTTRGSGLSWLDLDGNGTAETPHYGGGGNVVGRWLSAEGQKMTIDTVASVFPNWTDTEGVWHRGQLWYCTGSSDDSCGSRVIEVPHEPGDVVIPGDFDGDGIDGVLIYTPATRDIVVYDGAVYTPPTQEGGSGTYSLAWGTPLKTCKNGDLGDLPIAGKWSSSGGDGLGLYRVTQDNGDGIVNAEVWFVDDVCGPATGRTTGTAPKGAVPIAGDWDNDGIDQVGTYWASPQLDHQIFSRWQGNFPDWDIRNPALVEMDSRPTTLGFFTHDEPFGQDRLNELTALYATYQSQASHPLFHNMTYGDPGDGLWYMFAGLGDAVCADSYNYSPEGNTVYRMAKTVDDEVVAANGTRPVWLIQQAAGGAGSWMPPIEHYRATAYTAFIHGASGLTAFAWDGAPMKGAWNNMEMYGIAPEDYHNGDNAEGVALWNGIDKQQEGVNHELETLTPVLLSPTSTAQYGVYMIGVAGLDAATDVPLHSIIKTDPANPGHDVLIVANMTANDIRAHVQLVSGSAPATVTVEFENRSINTQFSAFQDSFGPYGTHVYRL